MSVKPNWKKILSTAFKISVSVILIAVVLKKLDWEEISATVRKSDPFFFGAAVLLFVLSQLISVFRFDIFIRKAGVRLDFKTNTRLYLLGMFYNFFIPGGVGGDAYKAVLISKSHNKSLKRIGKIVFIERFVGILAIGFVICLLVLFIRTEIPYYWNLILSVIGIIGCFIILRLVIRFLYANPKRVYLGFYYSLLVQAAQLASVLLILKSFGVTEHYLIYLLLFLVSSVLSVISFAGVGIREAVFFYGAQIFQFNADTSTMVALSFSLMTMAVSFVGIIYMFRKINLKR